MRSKLIFSAFLLLGLTTAFSGCDEEDDHAHNGEVNVQFEFVFGSSALPWAINQTMKHPKTGDTLTFTEFSFYVSNVKLQKEDGTWWSEPESYHLICAKCPDASMFTLADVPEGNYTGMQYTLGVDSARNVSGAQTGDLSPSKGMFWDWNSGYIMLKAEGSSPQSSDGAFTFHLGGFSGPNSVVTPKSVSFGSSTLSVSHDNTPGVVLLATPARLWHTAPSVSERSTIHMPGANAKMMADDFFGNISFKEIN